MPFPLIPIIAAGGAMLGSGIASKIGGAKSAGRLQDILEQYLKPELASATQRRNRLEDVFLRQVSTPEGFYGAASRAARGTASELFKPGGQVYSLLGKARGRSIASGFAPEGAEGAERGILRGAMEQIANRFAQESAGLEQTRIGALSGAYGVSQESLTNLLSSLFTGQASIESLRASERERGLLGLGIGGL